MSKRALRTASTIAQLLGVEGYSDYVHNQVKRYWKRIVMKGGPRRVRKLERDFSELVADMSDGDKLLLGKFISQRARESFDTGLRIGLMSFAHERDKSNDWFNPNAEENSK